MSKAETHWVLSDTLLGQAAGKSGYEGRLLRMWAAAVAERDTVHLLGNMVGANHAFWYAKLASLPGIKVLYLGDTDRNRIKWYYRWGFKQVVPISEVRIISHSYGAIVMSHLPCSADALAEGSNKFGGLLKSMQRKFELSRAVLNVHGHTNGKGKEGHSTVDASMGAVGEYLVTVPQLVQLKFKG